MELYLLIPFGNALFYTLAALCLKRSTNDGIGPWRTTFVSNVFHFALSFPFWFIGPGFESLSDLFTPFIISLGFFGGQLFVCLAIHKGDISVVTPLMGTKPVFVALLAIVFIDVPLSWAVWLAAVLSAVAILLMRGSTQAERSRLLPSIVYGLLSAAFFAASDVFMQRYGGQLGFEKTVSATFAFTTLWSFALIPLFRKPMSAMGPKAIRWLTLGSSLMAIQAMAMAFVLTVFGHVTEVNIVYSSRGLMSVALVWAVGHWFSNSESDVGRAEMKRRLIGASLLICAIVITVTFG